MRPRLFISILFSFVAVMDCAVFGQANRGKNFTVSAHRASTADYTLMNINNFSAWFWSNGLQEQGPSDNYSGAIFPRKTARVIYSSSVLWSGVLSNDTTNTSLMNGAIFSNGFNPGRIIGVGTGIADANAKERLWRIRRDYATANLNQDAAEYFGELPAYVNSSDVAELRQLYKKDWIEWPADKGAPFYDSNNDGIYTPKFTRLPDGTEVPVLYPDADEPGIANADQVLWYVCNSLAGTSSWQAPLTGFEIQTTIWGYNRTGALYNAIFKKNKIIFKGDKNTPAGTVAKDMYLAQYAQLDLGSPGDDLAGCDTVLNLGFVYNSSTIDNEFQKFGISAPALGYLLLQGPIIKGKPTDSAIFDFRYRKSCLNLPMTSFVHFGSGVGSFLPPVTYTSWWNNLMRGMGTFGGYRYDPISGLPTRFWVSGDPMTKSGWIDGVTERPGDRQFLFSSGPFTMALGDTQEIVVATIGGAGSNRLTSLSTMKFYAKQIRETYANLFALPALPSPPKYSAVELDRSIILEWEKDPAAVAKTEQTVAGSYQFEGYNVYQLPSRTASLAEGMKVATFDVKNDVTVITQDEFNATAGKVEETVVQSGTNSGISRYLYITRDTLRSLPLINGQHYYFTVTAYTNSSDSKITTKSLESTPSIIEVTPHIPNPGTSYPYSLNDSLINITRDVVGHNDGVMALKIFNPAGITGDTYELWYGGSYASQNWTVVKNLLGPEYVTLSAAMTADQEVPAIRTQLNSRGSASFTLNDARSQLHYTITIDSTSSTITGITIRRGAKRMTGPVLKTLSVGKKIEGYWTKDDPAQPLSDSVISDFIAGTLYINVQTINYPNGEIRGQIADGLVPRTDLPLATTNTSVTPITSYVENRLPNEGFSLFVGPAPLGFKSGMQVAPTECSVVNQVNKEGTYMLVGPSTSWAGYNPSEATLEFRFTADTNWAIVSASVPRLSGYMRVPFAIYKDSIRVWPVIQKGMTGDSSWGTEGNPMLSGQATFDKIVGIVNSLDPSGSDISYYSPNVSDFPPSTTSFKSRLINGVNHIAKNIVFVNQRNDGIPPARGTVIRLISNRAIKPGDIKSFTTNAVRTNDKTLTKENVTRITVFPNPYYGVNSFETNTSNRFVTFSHLPAKATVRIFTLAGYHVRTILKDDPSQFITWDLLNSKQIPVASGIYIAHINMGDVGSVVIKFAVIQEEHFLNNY